MHNYSNSHLHNHNTNTLLSTTSINYNKSHRYSSLDQTSCYSMQSTIPLGCKLVGEKMEKKYFQDKQRNNSQQKLTLTTSNAKLINFNQNNDNFKKNYVSPVNQCSKVILLQKKSKLNSLKSSQISCKFTGSTFHNNFQNNNNIQQPQYSTFDNFYQKNHQRNQKTQKSRSRGLIQINNQNHNNYTSNPEYTNFNKLSSTNYQETIKIKNTSKISPKNLELTSIDQTKKQLIQYFQEKLNKEKQYFNNIELENSIKIKQLQTIILLNRNQLENKNKKIKQLQQYIALKNHQQNYSKNDDNIVNKNNDEFLFNKIQDLNKKNQILQKFTVQSQQSLNEKIDKLNHLITNVMWVKMLNLKFIIKVFTQKNQKAIDEADGKVKAIKNIYNHQMLSHCQKLLEKAKQIVFEFRKISASSVNLKSPEKLQIQQLKNTVNTFHSSINSKTIQENMSSMYQSRSINDSFWNNLEDFPIGSHNKIDQPSFTDDSFSYGSGLPHTSGGSANEFNLRAYPSFSKLKESIQFNKLPQESLPNTSYSETIQEIVKFRQGAVLVYIDDNGQMRYKGSSSCIFDKRGNILKPTKEQIEYSINKGWIVFQ